MDRTTQRSGWWEMLFLCPLRGWRGWTVYAVLLGLLGVVYFSLAGQIVQQTNHDLRNVDQQANLALAYASSGDWYPHRSSYIQPLWPWVSRLVMHEDIETYFVRGRWLNLAIGYGLAVLLAVAAAWWMAPVPGFTIGLLAGIGVMLQRAHFFHPEPLLYALFTLATVFMALSLWRSRWIFYFGWGGALGLAYLAKASTTPLLAVYAGATLVLWTVRAGWWPRAIVRPGPASGWSWSRHAVGSLAALATVALLTAPGAVYKWRVHDDPFFNPAKYWMWTDDWDNGAVPITPRIQTAEGRAGFAPGELPTAANYLRRHGWEQSGERLSRGFREMGWRFLVPLHKVKRSWLFRMTKGNEMRGEPPRFWRYLLGARGLYLVWFAALAVLLLGARRVATGAPLFRSDVALPLLAFGAAATLGYLLAFGWYAPIINWRGERFTLMLYLPLLVGLSWSAWTVARDLAGSWWRYVYAAGVAAVLVHALVQTALLLSHPRFGDGI